MFRFLIPTLLGCGDDAFLFLDDYGAWDAVSAGFLFYQAIVFGYAFGWALGFGLNGCCCVQLIAPFDLI